MKWADARSLKVHFSKRSLKPRHGKPAAKRVRQMTSIKLTKATLIIAVTAFLVSVFSFPEQASSQGITRYTAPYTISTKLNIVMPTKILVYAGTAAGFIDKTEYAVTTLNGELIGYVRVFNLTSTFMEARIVSGLFGEYEGATVLFKPGGYVQGGGYISEPPRLLKEIEGAKKKPEPEQVEKPPRPRQDSEEIKKRRREVSGADDRGTVRSERRQVAETVRSTPSTRAVREPVRQPAQQTQQRQQTQSRTTPTVVNYMVMFEAHDDDEQDDDDYMYGMISATRKYENDMYGTLYYMRKENLDTDSHHANILGANAMWVTQQKTIYSVGYTYTDEHYSSSYDRDERAWNLGLSLLLKTQQHYYYRVGGFWTDRRADHGYRHRTYGPKIRGYYQLDENKTGKLAYTGTYSSTYNAHLANQYSAALTRHYTDGKLTFEYTHIDKRYTTPAVGVYSDDDNVFRISYLHTEM